ncbi:MAG: DUF2442 domain-containing protein [Planctomycetota bacterium]|nr:DUF2442 domain-containing protein [Planctomycetota bacterium]
MSTSIADEKFLVRVTRVVVTDDVLVVDLEDGRTISVPVLWYPRLVHGTAAERNNVEIGPFGIHWPDLDEDISIKCLLLGNKSGESPRSFQRWLEHRARGEKVPVRTVPLPEWAKDAPERH